MKWGDWTLSKDTHVLENKANGYGIPLDEIGSSAAMLDWIFQIQAKAWGDQKTMFELLRAFDDVLNPQACYCSGERDKRPDAEALVDAYIKSKAK
jgi:hypothetical protein